MKAQIIYKIINIINGKFYVGSTVNQRERFRAHRTRLRNNNHHCAHLQYAWNKYGEDNFIFKVIAHIPEDESIHEAENLWLSEHVGKEHCYNTSKFSEAPMKGRNHTTKAKALMSENRTGVHAGENHYRYGATLSEEVKRKIGDTQRGKPKGPGRKVSPEGMEKIKAAAAAGSYDGWLGRNHTEESKLKMSKKVDAIRPDGGIIHFTSITSMRLGIALKPATINRALKSGKPVSRGEYAGWSFKYA